MSNGWYGQYCPRHSKSRQRVQFRIYRSTATRSQGLICVRVHCLDCARLHAASWRRRHGAKPQAHPHMPSLQPPAYQLGSSIAREIIRILGLHKPAPATVEFYLSPVDLHLSLEEFSSRWLQVIVKELTHPVQRGLSEDNRFIIRAVESFQDIEVKISSRWDKRCQWHVIRVQLTAATPTGD
jgi:hypothetical protein